VLFALFPSRSCQFRSRAGELARARNVLHDSANNETDRVTLLNNLADHRSDSGDRDGEAFVHEHVRRVRLSRMDGPAAAVVTLRRPKLRQSDRSSS
jgi:hypothetical protein